MSELVVWPIGFVRSPYVEKAEAPRQGVVAGAFARVEVLAEYEDALADLAGFDRIWLLFWFDRAAATTSANKVLPPRSETKRGVFATRSPHRPNPIGMSAVALDRVEGRVVHVRELDLLDGTPVLDIKPYLPYADAFPDARAGWLEAPRDPRAAWQVRFEPLAEEQLAFLAASGEDAVALRARIEAALALGPQPHAYRRIRDAAGGRRVLAVKEWRARFAWGEAARTIIVERLASGWRARELAAHPLHAAFVARFEGP